MAVPSGGTRLRWCYGREPATAQGVRSSRSSAKFDLPRQAFDDVIDGVAMDLDKSRYETFDELSSILPPGSRRAVGMICIRIFRLRRSGRA